MAFRIKNFKKHPRILTVVLIVLVVVAGITTLRLSHAGTPFIVAEVEKGKITTPAKIVQNHIQFGNPKPFTLIVLPDTQVETQQWPNDFIAQTEWISANVTSKNIPFVAQVGDVQETPWNLDYYRNAQAAMNKLDGHVPYAVAMGNHDFDAWPGGHEDDIAKDRSSTRFNQFFPYSKFKAMPTFGGSYPTGMSDNMYHTFSAGDSDWLLITLKYKPTADELAWANQIVAANPKRRVIVVTHYYLRGDGTISAPGMDIWNNLVKKYSNIEFVLSGHVGTGALHISTGDKGNKVFEVLSDYQTYDDEEPNSYLRIMTFNPGAATVDVQTYSPAFKKYLTSAKDKFVITGVPFGQL